MVLGAAEPIGGNSPTWSGGGRCCGSEAETKVGGGQVEEGDGGGSLGGPSLRSDALAAAVFPHPTAADTGGKC
jgi:hypothetical protein